MEVLMDKHIGIDVAKATLQIYIPKSNNNLEIKNSPEGLRKLYSKLKKQYKRELKNIVFVYESTGAYSTILNCFIKRKRYINALQKEEG
jgi:transposase